MKPRRRVRRFLFCLTNRGYPAALVPQEVYEQLPDPVADKHGLVRVVDESGEDYLFPTQLFAPIELPPKIRARIRA